MGFVGNYAPWGLSPQTDGMPVIPKKPGQPSWFIRAIDGARTRGLDLGKVARYQLRHYRIRAGDGNRTHVSSLEGWCSTIELHPHIAVLFATTILSI